MDKLVSRRNALLMQLKWERSEADKIHDRIGEAVDRLDQLKEIADNFRKTQREIEENQPDAEAIASVHNYREEFTANYYRAKDCLEHYLTQLKEDSIDTASITSENTVVNTCQDLKEAMKMLLESQRTMMLANQLGGNVDSAGGEQVSNRSPQSVVRLPPINVPTFSGERKHWRSFKDIYETTIHNRMDLKDSMKMQYLVSYLEGDARRLVSSFPISDANYREACSTLTNFYDKKKYTVFALVREFVDQSAINTASSSNLRRLVTTSDDVVRQLNALGDEFNTRDPWLIHLLLEKIDKETRSLWAQRIIDMENPTFEEFLKFLDDRCDALETCTAFSKKPDGGKELAKKQPPMEKKLQSLHTAKAVEKCAKCSSEHPVYQCSEFKKLDIQSKRDLVQKAKLCYNCLRSSHIVKDCSSKSSCRTTDCKKRHHTLLCPLVDGSRDKHTEKSETSNNPPEVTEPVINVHVTQVPKEPQQFVPILPTAIVRVQGSDGNLQHARALLDSGSEASLISESCANKLGLSRSSGKFLVSGLGQQQAGTTRGLVRLALANRFSDTILLQTKAFVMGKLTSTLPTQNFKMNANIEQVRMCLADPNFNQPGHIDIILGSDVFLALLVAGQVKDNLGIPVAQNTIFGWIISGNHAIYTSEVRSNHSIINLHCDVDINRTLRQFWEVEEVPKQPELTTT
ncbi:uncharacterized protein LOC131438467 [Malaya genurostris]|uniref:uncharacterized protein LOC131438467 n=1 Tax=Malaya genurostris TaxID=325434 RepID=UPI0026F3B38D|nr:uncharacterized protein LOC131438467 [Malaya genurostris]